MRRRFLPIALFAFTLTACADVTTAPDARPHDPRFSMAEQARTAAVDLYNLADTAEARGDVYRPTLLRALVDALQFGSPMHTFDVTIDGQPVTFNATVMNAVVNLQQNGSAEAGMLLAWSGPNAERVLVVSLPHGDTVDGAMALYLDGDDQLRIASSGTASFSWSSNVLACVYDKTTALVSPSGDCVDGTASVAFALDFPEGTTPAAVSLPTSSLAGVQVTRSESDFGAVAAMLPALPRIAR